MLKKIVLVFIILLSLLFIFQPSNALVAINGCTNLSTGDTYQLTQNISSNISSVCFWVYSNNSVLDCNGFNVSDNFGLPGGSTNDIGIQLNNATVFGNITIMNCNFRNFYQTINFVTASGNVTIANNTFNHHRGEFSTIMTLVQANNTNISYNTFYNNSGSTLLNINGRQRDALIFNNTFNHSTAGVQINNGIANVSYNFFSSGVSEQLALASSAENVTVIGNTFFNCTWSGGASCINVNSRNTNITLNTFDGFNQTVHCIIIQPSVTTGTIYPTRVEGNTITNCSAYGINVRGNDAHPDNFIYNNNIYSNYWANIGIDTTIETYFTGVTNITGNRIYGSYGNPGAGIFINGYLTNFGGDKLGTILNNTFIYDNALIANNTYGVLINASNNVNLTNNTIFNNTYGIYFFNSSLNILKNNTLLRNNYSLFSRDSFATNFSLNNLSNNTFNIYLNSSNLTLFGRNYFERYNNSISQIINLTNRSSLLTINYISDIIESVDVLNLTFFNSSNVSLRVTNNTNEEGVSATNCQAAGYTCQLISNLLVIDNVTNTPGVFNLTLNYNETLITENNFNENQVQIARYEGGWREVGTNFVNATSNYVTLLGSLDDYSAVYAAVVIKTTGSGSSSGSGTGGSSGSGGGGTTGSGSSSDSTSTSSSTTQTTSVKENFDDGSSLDVTVNGKEINVNLNQYSNIDSVPDSDKESLQELADEFNGNVLIYEVELPNETAEELVNEMNLVFRIPLRSLKTIKFPDGLAPIDVESVSIGCYQVHDDGTRDKLETEETIDGDDLIVTVHVEDNSYFVITAEDREVITKEVVEEQLVKESKLKFIILIVVILLIIIGLVMFFVIRRKR